MRQAKSRFDIVGELGPLRRYAYALTRDESDAEELVQDALVRAYEKRSSFRAERKLRPWLLSILHNVFIDRIRSRQSDTEKVVRASEMAEVSAQPDQEHHVRLAQVRERFMSLPEEQRAALHLVAVEGLPYAEAAAALDVPIGTLMSRISRARATLRSLENEIPTGSAADRPPLKLVGGSSDTVD